jgi:hypothetical protein
MKDNQSRQNKGSPPSPFSDDASPLESKLDVSGETLNRCEQDKPEAYIFRGSI